VAEPTVALKPDIDRPFALTAGTVNTVLVLARLTMSVWVAALLA
jgi:hypothetical protein